MSSEDDEWTYGKEDKRKQPAKSVPTNSEDVPQKKIISLQISNTIREFTADLHGALEDCFARVAKRKGKVDRIFHQLNSNPNTQIT